MSGLPYSEEAEKAVLSLILREPDAFLPRSKADEISKALFHVPAHARIFETIASRHRDGLPLDLTTLFSAWEDEGSLESLGGRAGIMGLATFQPNGAHWDSHVSILRDRLARREAWKAGNTALEQSTKDSAEDALKTISEASERIKAALHPRAAMKSAEEAFADFFQEIEEQDTEKGKTPGLPTRIPALDDILGGMRPRELWIVGGETSAGKSVLSLQLAAACLRAGKHALVFSLEMGAGEVFRRMVSCVGGIRMGALTRLNTATSGEIQNMQATAKDLKESAFAISDEPGMTVDFIAANAERYAERNPVGAVVVDYIQLVEGDRRRHENREQELARTSRQLKQLAKRLNCTVISPSQLNDDGKLRESRAIGQDADVVLKIKPDCVRILKARNARRGEEIPITLDGEYQKFQ